MQATLPPQYRAKSESLSLPSKFQLLINESSVSMLGPSQPSAHLTKVSMVRQSAQSPFEASSYFRLRACSYPCWRVQISQA